MQRVANLSQFQMNLQKVGSPEPDLHGWGSGLDGPDLEETETAYMQLSTVNYYIFLSHYYAKKKLMHLFIYM